MWQLPAATAVSILSLCPESAALCVRVRTDALYGCGLELCWVECIILGHKTHSVAAHEHR